MLNDFKHLDNNLTVVYAKRGQAEKVPFYINTDCFDILNNGTDGYWSAVIKDGKLRIFSYTKGKNLRAARLIAGIANDSTKYIYLANGNEFDLRRENIIVYSGGVAFRKSSLSKKAKEIANSLPSLPSEDNDKANSTETEGLPKQTTSFKCTVLLQLEKDGKKCIIPVNNREEEEKIIRAYNFLTS